MIEIAAVALAFALFGIPTWGASFYYFLQKAMKSRMAVTACLAGMSLVFACMHLFMSMELVTGERQLGFQAVVAVLSFLVSVGTLATIKYVERKVKKGMPK